MFLMDVGNAPCRDALCKAELVELQLVLEKAGSFFDDAQYRASSSTAFDQRSSQTEGPLLLLLYCSIQAAFNRANQPSSHTDRCLQVCMTACIIQMSRSEEISSKQGKADQERQNAVIYLEERVPSMRND